MAVSLGSGLNKYLPRAGASTGHCWVSLKNDDITSNLTKTKSKPMAVTGRRLSFLTTHLLLSLQANY